MPPSPIRNEKLDKFKGCRRLFSSEDKSEEIEHIDTKWILDILGDDKDSPLKPVEDTSSKASLKNVFKNSKFFSSKSGIGSKQVTVTTSRKLNFDSVASSSKKNSFDKENKKEICIDEPRTEKRLNFQTPAPIKYTKTSLSSIPHYKESIIEVSRRLKEELVDNENSPSKFEYKTFSKDLKEWEKTGFSQTMK
jgi:hypothetical protein